jgi:hypothetical protein
MINVETEIYFAKEYTFLHDLNIAAISLVQTVVNRTFYKSIYTGCSIIFTGLIGFSQSKID